MSLKQMRQTPYDLLLVKVVMGYNIIYNNII